MVVSGSDVTVACYHPTPARRELRREKDECGQPTGRMLKKVLLWPPLGQENLFIPCGTCIGCKVDRSQEWAVRAVHEASQHEHNAFLTLTYRPDTLPMVEGHDGLASATLVPRDLTLFLKRVRKALASGRTALLGDRMRYLACGEYGDVGGRPHYHVLAFGLGFKDFYPIGKDLYSSPTLESLWGLGDVRIGEVTHASAAYVAQYTVKKLGKSAQCDSDGVAKKQGPFLRASLRPGIGTSWLHRYRTDLRYGYVVTPAGEKHKIPRYYRKTLPSLDPLLALEIEERAETHVGKLKAENQTPERKAAAETIALRRRELVNSRKL